MALSGTSMQAWKETWWTLFMGDLACRPDQPALGKSGYWSAGAVAGDHMAAGAIVPDELVGILGP